MDVDALAMLAANTVVVTAATDAFEELRARVARLFGRDKQGAAAERRLDATRQQLATAVPGDLEAMRAAQARQWETRFADLLADYPEAAGELQALLAELEAVIPESGGNVTNTISGTIHGSVVMGRDFGDITIGAQPDNDPGG